MQSKFKIDEFEPVRLKKADVSLDKHLKAALIYQKSNETYQERLDKVSLWKKFLRLFKRS